MQIATRTVKLSQLFTEMHPIPGARVPLPSMASDIQILSPIGGNCEFCTPKDQSRHATALIDGVVAQYCIRSFYFCKQF